MSDLFSLWVSLLSEGIALGFMLGFETVSSFV